MNGLRCWARLRPLWERAGVEVLPYQLESCRRVVEEMGGRAILADEVGLGKTVEAGLVACELMARGQARTVLILVPSGLTGQWQDEMAEKFGLRFLVNPEGRQWLEHPLVIASLDYAKRERHARLLLRRTFDLVVVDEAHRLKNRHTQNHQLVRALRPPYLLLLSATPLQNDLTELYSLVSLVRPDLLGSFNEFWRRFLIDKRTPKRPEELRAVLGRVMIRHRRRDLDLVFPEREAALLPLELFPEERALYDEVTRTVREEYHRRLLGQGSVLPLITLQREVCSSAQAVGGTLTRLARGEGGARFLPLLELARAVTRQRKAFTLLGLVREMGEKAIVFTEFLATQEYLVRLLRQAGVDAVAFHGGQSAGEKEDAIRRFQGPAQVLVSTECGGQGLNLQFCRRVVNYDLPWNPMRVEQRIGRVHRLGQEAEVVYIYNLCARDTIEEHILRLLDEKIHLFRQVIGELDVILRHLERRRSLEHRITEIALTARTREELEWAFARLGAELADLVRRLDRTAAEALPR